MQEDESSNFKTNQPEKSPFAFIGAEIEAESWEDVRANAVAVLGVLDDSYQDCIEANLQTKLVRRMVAITTFLPAPMIM